MTDTLEDRAIEAAKLAIDNVHDMDVTLGDYARASALAVLAEFRAKGTDADLIADADAAILKYELFFPDPLARPIRVLRDALAAANAREAALEADRDRLRGCIAHAVTELAQSAQDVHAIRAERALKRALTGDPQP